MMLPVQPFTAHSSSQQQLSSPVGTAAQHNRCATHSKRGTIRPLCASTRHASTPSTTDRGTTLSTISQHWYADYHGVVQRLERLYWQRVGQRDVEQADDNVLAVQLNEPSTSSASSTTGGGGGGGKDDDFYVNAGVAIRTLREDIPQLFQQDLDCTFVGETTATLHPPSQTTFTARTLSFATPAMSFEASKTTAPSFGRCAFTGASFSATCTSRSSPSGNPRTSR